MPRVITKTKNRAGRERQCGRCGRKIEPGDKYYTWSFRYGGTAYRCIEHRPRQSELTQSKMSTVYAAIEGATDDLPNADDPEAVAQLVQDVAEAVREVADEYEEAAEPFGGAGENAERADELHGWADELECWEPATYGDDADSALDEARTDAEAVLAECPL